VLGQVGVLKRCSTARIGPIDSRSPMWVSRSMSVVILSSFRNSFWSSTLWMTGGEVSFARAMSRL